MAHALISVFGAALLAGSLIAQLKPDSPSAAGMSQSQLERASGLILSEIQSGRVGAAAILVARYGRVVLHKGFGRLSPAQGAPPVSPDSVFLLASITKPVTACSLMLLVERGLVSLGDRVDRYLPDSRAVNATKSRFARRLFSHNCSTVESDRHDGSDGAEISCPFCDPFVFAGGAGRLRGLSAARSLAPGGARPNSIPELLRSLPSV